MCNCNCCSSSNTTEKNCKEIMVANGVCTKCGEMFSHHIDSPLASCKCGVSEWYKLTPYMKLEAENLKLKSLLAEVYEALRFHDVDPYILDQILAVATGKEFS